LKDNFLDYRLLFLIFSLLYSQKEHNITSLIKIEGIYRTIKSENSSANGIVYKMEKNKKRYIGELVDGKKNGTWTEVYQDQRILVEKYKKGKLDGSASLYYKNGQKEWRYNYTNGTLNGTYSRWFRNGQKAIDGYFENGKPVGIWAWWNKDGKFLKKERYKKKKNGLATGYNQYTDKINIKYYFESKDFINNLFLTWIYNIKLKIFN